MMLKQLSSNSVHSLVNQTLSQDGAYRLEIISAPSEMVWMGLEHFHYMYIIDYIE